jgi:hypothetical protein
LGELLLELKDLIVRKKFGTRNIVLRSDPVVVRFFVFFVDHSLKKYFLAWKKKKNS